MQKDQIKQFLAALGAKNVSSHGAWVTCSCILAPWTHDSGTDSHPSFAVKVHDTESMFNCFSCKSGNLAHLLMLLRMYGATAPKFDLKKAFEILDAEQSGDLVLNIKDYGEKSEEEFEFPYAESWLNTFVPWHASEYAVDYLQFRDVPPAVADFLNVRYDSARHAVAFPIRDFTGTLMGLRARYCNPGEGDPRYHIYKTNDGRYNKHHWLGEPWVDFDRPVLMVESVFDLARAYRVYRNVVAPLTVGMDKAKVLRMRQSLDIVTLFDHGKGGDKARELIDRYLSGPRSIQHVQMTEEDEDPGKMPIARMVDLLAPHIPLDPPIN